MSNLKSAKKSSTLWWKIALKAIFGSFRIIIFHFHDGKEGIGWYSRCHIHLIGTSKSTLWGHPMLPHDHWREAKDAKVPHCQGRVGWVLLHAIKQPFPGPLRPQDLVFQAFFKGKLFVSGRIYIPHILMICWLVVDKNHAVSIWFYSISKSTINMLILLDLRKDTHLANW